MSELEERSTLVEVKVGTVKIELDEDDSRISVLEDSVVATEVLVNVVKPLNVDVGSVKL
jgi:hypothetical protein